MNYQTLNEEDLLWLSRIDDFSQKVLKYKTPQFTQFCDPHAVRVLQNFGQVSPFVNVMFYGGYADSERNVVGFFPDFSEPSQALFPISALCIKGAGDLGHREFLGSLMALGIKRSMIGDIIIDSDQTILFCMDSISDYILMNLSRIGRQRIVIEKTDICLLSIKPREFIEVSGTVASLRLDCVLGLAAKISRAKAQDCITKELVNVNFSPVVNPAHSVKEGDVISLRKFGRIAVEQILGTSKKGRIKIIMKRYL